MKNQLIIFTTLLLIANAVIGQSSNDSIVKLDSNKNISPTVLHFPSSIHKDIIAYTYKNIWGDGYRQDAFGLERIKHLFALNFPERDSLSMPHDANIKFEPEIDNVKYFYNKFYHPTEHWIHFFHGSYYY